MLAAIDWSNLTVAAAFILGAILATIATLRVVRAVTVMFGGELRRGRRGPPPDDPPEPSGGGPN